MCMFGTVRSETEWPSAAAIAVPIHEDGLQPQIKCMYLLQLWVSPVTSILHIEKT